MQTWGMCKLHTDSGPSWESIFFSHQCYNKMMLNKMTLFDIICSIGILIILCSGVLSCAMYVRCSAAVMASPSVTTNKTVSRHANCPLGDKFPQLRTTVLKPPLHTCWQLVRWAGILRTRVFIFGFTSDSLKTLQQVKKTLIGLFIHLYSGNYFPYYNNNMFVGENVKATEKYKEENLKRSVSISTT